VRSNSDIALSSVKPTRVILSGTESSPYLIEAEFGMSWNNVKDKGFIKKSEITEEDWNSMSNDEILKILSCN
jgi:hypothetical protein